MYFILNNYGDPKGDYLQVAFNACDSAWSMTMLLYLNGKEYTYADCGYDKGRVKDKKFWHDLFCNGVAMIVDDLKRDIPLLDTNAYCDQCCKKVDPGQFDISNWSYVKGLECRFGGDEEEEEAEEAK